MPYSLLYYVWRTGCLSYHEATLALLMAYKAASQAEPCQLLLAENNPERR